MCNLAGWVGDLSRKEVEKMLLTIFPGNPHATGVALHQGNTVAILKAPKPAPQFIANKGWAPWFNRKTSEGARVGMMHTRLATNGAPENNENNHPHYSEAGSVLVHKGIVFPKVKYPAVSECDSEQLLHSLDTLGLVEGINNCPGWATIAYIRSEEPAKIWLYTSAGSLYVWRWDGVLLFSTVPMTNTFLAVPRNTWLSISVDKGDLTWGPKVLMPSYTPKIYVTNWKERPGYEWESTGWPEEEDNSTAPWTRKSLQKESRELSPALRFA